MRADFYPSFHQSVLTSYFQDKSHVLTTPMPMKFFATDVRNAGSLPT
jgi:hypothetical protein